MIEQLYILQYHPDGQGCPHHLSGRYNQTEWEWDVFETRPHDVEIKKTYSFKITDREVKYIDFDYYGTDSIYVSEQFVSVCEDWRVNFRAVPLEIIYPNRKRSEKSYFVFLPANHLPILDRERSVYKVELILETGQPMMDHLFPQVPIYQKIEKFVAKDLDFPPLFQCVELQALVCTEKFREYAMSSKLRGLKFVPLDENYTYDLWAGW